MRPESVNPCGKHEQDLAPEPLVGRVCLLLLLTLVVAMPWRRHGTIGLEDGRLSVLPIEEPAIPGDQTLSSLFARSKGALVKIYPTWEEPGDEDKPGGWYTLGFFVSRNGRIVTTAHILPTTRPILVAYESNDGSSHSSFARTVKYDAELDLALLQPVKSLSPSHFLQLDLRNTPKPGQRIAIITAFVREAASRDERYFVSAILERTISAVFRDGLFAADNYAFAALSGSPVVDLSSEAVIGVCVGRNRGIEPYQHEIVAVPSPKGTTVSVPALYLVYNYIVIRSVASAKDFFRVPREVAEK